MKKKMLGLLTLVVTTLIAGSAFAQDAGSNEFDMKALGLLGAGFGMGIAAFGGALGQGKAIASAAEGIARNPSAAGEIRGILILGLILIESLVIYSLVISFMILGKV